MVRRSDRLLTRSFALGLSPPRRPPVVRGCHGDTEELRKQLAAPQSGLSRSLLFYWLGLQSDELVGPATGAELNVPQTLLYPKKWNGKRIHLCLRQLYYSALPPGQALLEHVLRSPNTRRLVTSRRRSSEKFQEILQEDGEDYFPKRLMRHLTLSFECGSPSTVKYRRWRSSLVQTLRRVGVRFSGQVYLVKRAGMAEDLVEVSLVPLKGSRRYSVQNVPSARVVSPGSPLLLLAPFAVDHATRCLSSRALRVPRV